jgi:serine protease Do
MATGFGEIAEALRRATVHISEGNRRGGGSGVIWSPEGLIVTNAHVARAPRLRVELWDGRAFMAGVVSRDPRRDLATIRVPASNLPFAPAADSSTLRAGELVIAIGNPLGFTGALTTGVVHSIGPLPGMGRQSWVRADVRLAPGNSGGPLANAMGHVVGINTAIVRGLGVAVPANSVSSFLRSGARPALGVAFRPVEPGLLLLEVQPGGAAAQAELWVGDILAGANGRPLRTPDDLADALDSGDPVLQIDFMRGGVPQTRRVAVRIANRSAEAA